MNYKILYLFLIVFLSSCSSNYGTDNTFNILGQNDEYIFWILQKEKMVIKTRNDDLLLLKEKCR